jgi:excisionase family DNA binding protein
VAYPRSGDEGAAMSGSTDPTTYGPVHPSDGETHSPLLLSVAEVALLLRIHRTTVYDLLATGELRSTTLGRRRLIPRAALEEFVALLDRRAQREAAEHRTIAHPPGSLDGSAHDR